jgi:predicted nuclease of predicted toxin-antitoxin system
VQFLVDECTGPAVARWLRDQGHEVFSVFDEGRGMTDDEIILKAYSENRILITNDKGFGEQIYRKLHPHHGVDLLRLADESAAAMIDAPQKLLVSFAHQLPGRFVVVTETRVRFGGLANP